MHNFPQAMPFQIAKSPQMWKREQEDQDTRFFRARMESGKCWIQHLPETF